MAVRRGVVLVFVLIFIAVMMSMGFLFLLSMAAGSPVHVPQNATLYLPLQAPLPEVEPADVFALVSHRPTLGETIESIRKAKRDSRVKALVISPSAPGAMWGQVQELRAELEDFKTSGKSIVAFLEFGGAQEYYLASAATRIVLVPGGQLDLNGLATYELFFRGALDKLGVVPDLVHAGDYKTAANTFTERSFTKAHMEMSRSLNRDWYDHLVSVIAAARKKTVEDVRRLIDTGPFLPEAALQAGLIDQVAYEDQLDDEEPVKGTQRLDAQTYTQAIVPLTNRASGSRIAVLYAVGTIASGKSSFEGAAGLVVGSQTFVEWLRKVRVDPTVRAIVVRVDSPGGSAIASEVIWRELMLTREQKPLVVSMGDVAASGGYYIAMPAHAIVAQPGTLTGSIGVVTGKFVLGGTMDKLGIGTGAVSDGAFAEMYSPFRPFTPAERARVEEQMQATYEMFLARVTEGRKSSRDKIDAVAQGRVWTGQQALERGLVDELGGLDRAIRLAKERAKLDVSQEVDLLVYPQKPSLYEIFANPLGTTMTMGLDVFWRKPETDAVTAAANALRRFRRGEALLLMPNVFVR